MCNGLYAHTCTCMQTHTCGVYADMPFHPLSMPKYTHKDVQPPSSIRTRAQQTSVLTQQDPSSERPGSLAVVPPQSHCHPCLRGPDLGLWPP